MSTERIFPYSSIGKNRIITVTGISASGKDYLTGKTLEADPTIKNGVNFVNFGTELFNAFISDHPEFKESGRDALKHLPFEEIERLVQDTVTRIIDLQPVIQSTHVLNKQRGALTINPQSERRMNAADYVFVHSDPTVIYSRRLQDQAGRNRELESIDDIALHQKLALAVVTSLASASESGLIVVDNDPASVMNNIDVLASEFRNLL